MAHNREKMTLSNVSSVLRYNEILEESLPFLRMLISLLTNDKLAPFAGLMQARLGEV